MKVSDVAVSHYAAATASEALAREIGLRLAVWSTRPESGAARFKGVLPSGGGGVWLLARYRRHLA